LARPEAVIKTHSKKFTAQKTHSAVKAMLQ